MEAKTILDQINVDISGFVGVRFALQVINGDQVLSSQWHRTSFAGDTVTADMLAVVNTHLESMGFPPVSAEDAAKIDAVREALK